MNRRNFLAGSAALAGQHKLLRSMGALSFGGQMNQPLVAPHNLLSTTYTEEFLQSKLLPLNQWHPYPRCSERAAWEAVPADIRTAIVDKALAERKEGWQVLLATSFLEFKRNGNRTRYQDVNFGRRSKLQHLVLAECLEGKGRFLDDITNGVWLICEESFWGAPAHLGMQKAGPGLPDVTDPVVELFGAETVQLLAWTKYLLGEQLDTVSPLINKRIVIESERRILGPARNRNDFWWMGFGEPGHDDRVNNWTPWINSNLLIANLILEEDPQLRLHEITRITRSVDAYLNDYWPDAGEEEGPGYFSRSPLCFFECVSTLESATGNSTKIFADPFIDAMGRFILNVHIAGDDYVDYGDVHGKAAPEGDVLYRYGKAVHDAQLEAFGAYYAMKSGWAARGEGLQQALNMHLPSLSRSLPAILAANEIRSARQEDVLVRDAWYPDFGLMTARVKAGSTDGMYVAVLAANNGRSHSHNDTGNFVIYEDGQPVAIDVGVEAYTAKTFSADRYSIWTMQSAYHNLPTVGGVMQHNGVQYRATDRRYETSDRQAKVSFNIADAYPKDAGIRSWMRTVTLDRVNDKVTIEENFDLERAVPVSLSIMTSRIPAVSADGSITMRLASGEGKDALLKFSGAELKPVVEKIAITDPNLREDWGSAIYRIRLNTRQSVAKGNLSYEFSKA
ncbi:MAG: heparinase II/III family protein [Acidobacteriota bacterium]